MSHRDSKEEINENEFLNLENIEFDVKKEKNCLPSFLLESLNENDYDNYFKDELSTDEINNSTEEEKKEKSNFNYKMHSFDDSKKIKIDLPKNINLNYNFTPSNQFICSNNYNEIFNNQILNSKQYSFNNKNANYNTLYQQFFPQNNFPQMNNQFNLMNNYCMNQMMMNLNNNIIINNINNNINLNNTRIEKNENNIINNNSNIKNNNLNNNYNMTLNSILLFNEQEFFSLITTQKGSRTIQNVILTSTEKEIDIILEKIKNKSSEIMIDKYGNYFFQKLIEKSTIKQREFILNSIKDYFIEIANNSFGTHPLQYLIEKITSKKEKEIILNSILGKELNLGLDSKGTYVLQKFISLTKDEERLLLNKNILNHISKLINDPFGVCVLIKLIKHTNDKYIKIKISKFISDNNPLSFIQHPYSNYVVQSLFNENDIIYCDNIIKVIIENFYVLSLKKFSSNVVENCLKFGNENIVYEIYKNIILSEDKIEVLLNNIYGNFVIEKLILRLNKEEKNNFFKVVQKIGKEKLLSNNIMKLIMDDI